MQYFNPPIQQSKANYQNAETRPPPSKRRLTSIFSPFSSFLPFFFYEFLKFSDSASSCDPYVLPRRGIVIPPFFSFFPSLPQSCFSLFGVEIAYGRRDVSYTSSSPPPFSIRKTLTPPRNIPQFSDIKTVKGSLLPLISLRFFVFLSHFLVFPCCFLLFFFFLRFFCHPTC